MKEQQQQHNLMLYKDVYSELIESQSIPYVLCWFVFSFFNGLLIALFRRLL